jgi:ketosteroid isomerase-like protein
MRIVALTVVLGAVAIAAVGQTDAVGTKNALLKADRDFNQATQEHRLDGWMQYMDYEGVVERGKPVVGEDAVRAALKPDWDDPNFHLTWDPDEAYALPGNKMGYTRGHWELTSRDKDGNPIKLTGQYLTIWRLDKQHQWKIIWDGGSADPPKAPAEKN